MYKCVFIAIFAALINLTAYEPSHEIVRRAAFDIGSGQVKMQVSDVDLTTNKIVNELFSARKFVQLKQDLSTSLDGRLSVEIQGELIDTIQEMIQKAKVFHPDQFQAIATSPLRLAKNGREVAQKIEAQTKLPVKIVTQEEEGIIGFNTALCASSTEAENLLCCDFGGGSFQVASKEGDCYSVFEGHVAQMMVEQKIREIQGQEDTKKGSINPVSQQDFEQITAFIAQNIEDLPVQIAKKIKRQEVKVCGIGIYPFVAYEKGQKEAMPTYSVKQLKREIESLLDLSDEEIVEKYPRFKERPHLATYVASTLMIQYGILTRLGIDQVEHVDKPGANAVGLLVSDQYW